MVLAVICIVAASCYKQVPLNTTHPAPTTRIVATLTDSGIVAMGNALGPGATEVEGVVSNATDSQWTLQLIRVEHRDGRSITWNREPVPFLRTLLANPMMVTVDRKRSWLAAGGIVIGAFLIAKSFNVIGGDEGSPPVDDPERAVVPRIQGSRR